MWHLSVRFIRPSEKEAPLSIMVSCRKSNSFDCAFLISSPIAVEKESGKFCKPSASPDCAMFLGTEPFLVSRQISTRNGRYALGTWHFQVGNESLDELIFL